jgi:hypothetical protein
MLNYRNEYILSCFKATIAIRQKVSSDEADDADIYKLTSTLISR